MKDTKFLNSKEVKGIMKMLTDQFGYNESMNYYFIINSKNKIYIINKEIANIDFNIFKIDTMGLYFGEIYNEQIRLSIEGSQIIGPKSHKNIIEITGEQVSEWMKGDDLQHSASELKGFLIIKNNGDFLGCGRFQEGKLRNYISKSRKLKVVNS